MKAQMMKVFADDDDESSDDEDNAQRKIQEQTRGNSQLKKTAEIEEINNLNDGADSSSDEEIDDDILNSLFN